MERPIPSASLGKTGTLTTPGAVPTKQMRLPSQLPVGMRSTHKEICHDAASFRSACSLWRAAVPFTTFGPLLLLPFDPDSDRVGFYYVPEKVLSKTLPDVRGKVACGTSCGWLALMDEAVSVTPLNPFAGARAPRVELPPAGRAIKLEDMRDVFFREIMLSSPPDVTGCEYMAMAMLGCSTEVAFCRVRVDSAWTLLDTKLEFSVGSIVHC
ncbi:uncharacterized protein [Miscanthus floridulus]|uniref:uncharacterized protein n=1 Tax=Miscanthus floridulus TaxID=154761 RepID=UPI00345890A6